MSFMVVPKPKGHGGCRCRRPPHVFLCTCLVLLLVLHARILNLSFRTRQEDYDAASTRRRVDSHHYYGISSGRTARSMVHSSRTNQNRTSPPPRKSTTVHAASGSQNTRPHTTTTVTVDPPPAPPSIQYLSSQDFVELKNAYSAAWWQSVDRFQQVNLTAIQNPEGAVFETVINNNQNHSLDDIRMTKDWLYLSVEHLSKWWKVLEFDNPKLPRTFDRIVDILWHYTHRDIKHERLQSGSTSPMKDTVGVLAYAPIHSNINVDRAIMLEVVVFSATLHSLLRQGIGRLVIVTDDSFWAHLSSTVWPLCRNLLLTHGPLPKNRTDWSWQAMVQDHQMTQPAVGIQNETETMVSRNHQDRIHGTDIVLLSGSAGPTRNVPRLALSKLHQAFFPHGNPPKDHPGDQDTLQERQILLGGSADVKQWEYLYYTEYDSLLYKSTKQQQSSNRQLFQSFRTLLNEGKILIPHRLQPLPHEYDFYSNDDHQNHHAKWTNNGKQPSKPQPEQGDMRRRYQDPPVSILVPAIPPWNHVTQLQGMDDACCDAGQKEPYVHQSYPKCPSFWYLCGFVGGSRRSAVAKDVQKQQTRRKQKQQRQRQTLEKQQPQRQQKQQSDKDPVLNTTLIRQVHQRLEHYQLIRLDQGSGIVHLAATEHGRQCIPRQTSRDGPCP